MNCREAELLIPRFLNDEMDNWQLEEFLAHVTECSACEEELTIQLLVKVGLERLTDDGDFNLKKELDSQLRSAHQRLKRRAMLQGISFALQAMVAVCVVAVIILARMVL